MPSWHTKSCSDFHPCCMGNTLCRHNLPATCDIVGNLSDALPLRLLHDVVHPCGARIHIVDHAMRPQHLFHHILHLTSTSNAVTSQWRTQALTRPLTAAFHAALWFSLRDMHPNGRLTGWGRAKLHLVDTVCEWQRVQEPPCWHQMVAEQGRNVIIVVVGLPEVSIEGPLTKLPKPHTASGAGQGPLQAARAA